MTAESGFWGSLSPLAARMRPRTLSEVVGQNQVTQPGSPLHSLATSGKQKGSSVSLILWGPPGTGKTSLAQVIAGQSGMRFSELSAVTAGVKDVREVMVKARKEQEAFGAGTVLFLDEIHRFSKAQQDALLPGVEAGWVTLIAATTENPSFSVVAPLLSRSLLVTLQPLTDEDIAQVVSRAISDPRGLDSRFRLTDEAAQVITRLSGGDARRALTILEAAANSVASETIDADLVPEITIEHVSKSLDHALVRYDRDGDQHYDVISAFIKSVRGSDVDAALHYLARMIEGGEDPRFIARRLIILASEDVGLADPQALPLAVAAHDAVSLIGMPEGRIPLAEATVYLALAPKSNSAYLAINQAIADVRSGFQPQIPLSLRSSNYSGAKAMGNGLGYVYPHDDLRAVVSQEYLAGEGQKKTYWIGKALGFERELTERWARLRSVIRARPNQK
ncbi:MAG: replication-associated recombination protein A [Micrococcales bacterium]